MPDRPRAHVRARRRAVPAGTVLVLLLAAGGGVWTFTRTGATAAAPVEVAVAAALGTQRTTVTASGTVEPARRADLAFVVPGTVTSVPAVVGQHVTAGQPLATVGSTALQAAVDSAAAQVTAAQAALTAAADAGGTAAQLAAVRAQVASAQSKLADAQSARAAATLTSTIDGTVAAVGLATGDRVSGSSTGSGTGGSGQSAAASSSSAGVVTVISTDAYVVQAAVGSADLARLRKGLQAEITPTGATQKVFGTVASVGIVATASTSTGGTSATSSATFPVAVDVTGSPTGLYAGGSASVVLVITQTPDVLTVPTLALHTTDAGTVVHQSKGGQQVSTPVTVGASYGAATQITHGLAAGDEVLVPTGRPGSGTSTRGTTGTRGTGGGGGFGGSGLPGGGSSGGGGGFGGPAGGAP